MSSSQVSVIMMLITFSNRLTHTCVMDMTITTSSSTHSRIFLSQQDDVTLDGGDDDIQGVLCAGDIQGVQCVILFFHQLSSAPVAVFVCVLYLLTA